MTVKAHCMGMEFPKRDTDSPKVDWLSAFEPKYQPAVALMHILDAMAEKIDREIVGSLPSAADLDAAAEEQRVKEKTGG